MNKKNKLKIIHISQNLDDSFGGPPKSVPYLCNALNELGLDTQLLSVKLLDNEFNTVIDRFNLQWNTFAYKYLKKLRYAPKMKKYIESQISKNTILHVHNPWNYVPYLVYKISKKHKLPFMISARGSFYEWSLKQSRLQKFIAWNLFQKDMLNEASFIHATEINEAKALRKIGCQAPIAVVPNGIDLSEFENLCSKEESKKKLKLDVSKNYILFLSRIHPKKGLEYLVNSFIKLATKYKKYELLIVGPTDDEKYQKTIDKLISNSNLDNRIHFLGMLQGNNRIDVYNASSLFVLPSHTENFGIAIAEAMVAKLPVITTHGTPWHEIKKNDAGWWVELSQESIDSALAEALACREDELKQKGLNGFGLIEKYSWEYQARKMKQVYEWVLGKKNEKPDFVYEVWDRI